MNEENEMQKRLQTPAGQQIFEVTGTEPLTPMNMIERAISQGAGIDVLERLLSLQERWETGQGRKAFDEAISAARGELPRIVKNREVSFGTGKAAYKYETLDNLLEQVSPILAKHGLTARWRTSNKPGEPVMVTCIISHRLGHFEENTLQAAVDTSGNKNPIQAIGSAVSYLQRYTLKASLGIAAAQDDDAQAAGKGGGKITDEEASEISVVLLECGADEAAFCRYMKVGSLTDIPASRLDDAWAAIKAKQRTNLKKQLEASVAQVDAEYAKIKDGE
jgi:hypothetical protein